MRHGYFYPRPPRGGRHAGKLDELTQLNVFLSTPSARRATNVRRMDSPILQISIHALREEGDQHGAHSASRAKISIHALREEGDCYPLYKRCVPLISIHALREEGDVNEIWDNSETLDFYPRPPRGGRPKTQNRYPQ